MGREGLRFLETKGERRLDGLFPLGVELLLHPTANARYSTVLYCGAGVSQYGRDQPTIGASNGRCVRAFARAHACARVCTQACVCVRWRVRDCACVCVHSRDLPSSATCNMQHARPATASPSRPAHRSSRGVAGSCYSPHRASADRTAQPNTICRTLSVRSHGGSS